MRRGEKVRERVGEACILLDLVEELALRFDEDGHVEEELVQLLDRNLWKVLEGRGRFVRRLWKALEGERS